MRCAVRVIAAALLCAGAGAALADDSIAASGASLRARHLALHAQLGDNPFRRPLHLESIEARDHVTGDIYARVGFPFESASAALSVPGDWCDILMLHINTKACRVTGGVAGANQNTVLGLWIGKKQPQALADASQVDFAYRVEARTGNYLRVGLNAGAGPMATRDYRILLEAIPLENGQTFIHLGYSYGFGGVGRLAMQTYLATVGSGKVGFTVVGAEADGRSRYIGGMRGLVERNAMRYYLAIEAFLGAQSVSAPARFEKRMRDWYQAIELYPRQLHDVAQREYFDMKRMEQLRQKAGPA